MHKEFAMGGNQSSTFEGLQLNQLPVTREAVVWAYRILLGRDPENEDVIQRNLHLQSVAVLRDNILRSAEFQGIATRIGYEVTEHTVVRCKLIDDILLYIDLKDRFVSLGCLRGDYEAIETNFILSNLSDGDGFIDVGANIGWYTCRAAKKVGPRGRVYAFEPRSEAFAMLRAAIADNGFDDRVELYKCGLFDKRTKLVLRWSNSGENPGGATVCDTISDLGHQSEIIQLDRLDAFNVEHPIKLMKIDVEGAEYLVMKGGQSTITMHRPIIMAEILSQQILSVSKITPLEYIIFVQSLGYTMHELNANGTAPVVETEEFLSRRVVTNVVFMPIK
jgi:FkbM family methyltransferase